MNLYTFNKELLTYDKISFWKLVLLFITTIFLTSVGSYHLGLYNGERTTIIEAEEEMIVVEKSKDDFSREKLEKMLNDLNVKFPDIIIAQAEIETGNFKSKIFQENKNLFGMKQAVIRANTAKGTQYGHAYYDTWRESVYDYVLYQCRYLSRLRTKEEYLEYIDQHYAEDTLYVNKIVKLLQ